MHWPPAKKTMNSKFNLGIRPEHITISSDSTRGTFSVIVESVKSTGNMSHVAGQALNITATSRLSAKAGEAIRLSFAPESLHLFDPETGLCV